MTAVAIHPGGVIAIPLGEPGEQRKWVIGRGKDADIVVEEASLSRRHAVLHGGSTYTLEDLGSENGTMIVNTGGVPTSADETHKLVSRPLARGERAIMSASVHAQLGRVTLVIQPGTAAGAGWQAAMPAKETPIAADVVVKSPEMQRVYWLADRFAQGKINVLLVGETGVGKEVLAEHIHRASPRAGGPFLRLNCASFRGELLESELFGHERGAFTGAVAAKPGLVELAHGGTLFLDEIGETPLDLQSRLLRFLEDRQALRVGGTEARKVDVRIISATNRELSSEISSGRFRSDLFFRLDGVTVEIPPLRARHEEIVPLAEHFVRQQARALGWSAPPALDPEAAAALKAHSFPGNVRELRNLIERALLLAAPGEPLLAEHLMIGATGRTSSPRVEPPSQAALGLSEDDERRRVIAALDACGGNQTRAAKALGMTRKALIVRLERYGVTRPRRPSNED